MPSWVMGEIDVYYYEHYEKQKTQKKSQTCRGYRGGSTHGIRAWGDCCDTPQYGICDAISEDVWHIDCCF